MSNYRFNNQDPETAFNMQILKGFYEQIDVMPKLKDNGLSIDWAGENGTERYHGAQRFESKVYDVPCAVLCTSTAQYEASMSALMSFFITAGEFNLDIINRNKRLKVSYQDMKGFKRYGNKALFTLVLVDDHPTEHFTIS